MQAAEGCEIVGDRSKEIENVEMHEYRTVEGRRGVDVRLGSSRRYALSAGIEASRVLAFGMERSGSLA